MHEISHNDQSGDDTQTIKLTQITLCFIKEKTQREKNVVWVMVQKNPRLFQPPDVPYLLTVLADVRVDLVERAEHVELCGVESGLLCQIGIHVLVTNGRQPADVSIVPANADKRKGSASAPRLMSYF